MNALTLGLGNARRAGKALGLCAMAVGFALSAARAQEFIPPGPDGRGAFLIYGNFCGPGNRGPGYPPIDALDRACAEHDTCSPDLNTGVLSSCSCNQRLVAQSSIIARDPHAPAKTRDAARFIADFMTTLPCQ